MTQIAIKFDKCYTVLLVNVLNVPIEQLLPLYIELYVFIKPLLTPVAKIHSFTALQRGNTSLKYQHNQHITQKI